MDADFWHERWESDNIGFHLDEANPLLAAHFGALELPAGSRVLVPLCGKSRDIAWLLVNGYRVVGVELSGKACEQLFDEMGVQPAVVARGDFVHYAAPQLDIYRGDIFALSQVQLGSVDAVYDRAALVALPADMRARYAAHVAAITATAPELLITYEYDQSVAQGPPFSVGDDEVRRLYETAYRVTPLAREVVAGGLRGVCPASEHVWLLSPRRPRQATGVEPQRPD